MSDEHLKAPGTDPLWTICEDGFDPGRELEIESLLSVCNGYAGTRGTLFERGSPLGPGTLVAGIFDPIPGDTPVPGLVASPDWIRLRIDILNAEDCGLTSGEMLKSKRTLDMKTAVMWRELTHKDNEGRISSIRSFRLASQANRHLFLQSMSFTPVNYTGLVRIEAEAELTQSNHRSYLNPYPIRSSVLHDTNRTPGTPAIISHLYRNGAEIAFATASRLILEDGQIIFPQVNRIGNRVAEHWELDAELGRTYRIDRLVSIFTSRDVSNEKQKAGVLAREHLNEAWRRNSSSHIKSHLNEWQKRWTAANIEIKGDHEAERALHFACYSLLSAANPEDERVSIGARALTGNAYLGHVFWDTEIFMLPFFVHSAPDIARSLLMYRANTLPGARKNAAKNNYSGAMYAWESADTGEETTPTSLLSPTGERIKVLTGEQEHHITGDVAYAVWQYAQLTGDRNFFLRHGAEIMIETARFWASRVSTGSDGFYHIEHVIGPDEYHEDVTDSVYTNELARWNLRQAAALAATLPKEAPQEWGELATKIAFQHREANHWMEIAERLARPRVHRGVLEQFQGYFDLEDVTARKENQPGGTDFRMFLEPERLRRSQLIKQADVVMLLHLFSERFTAEERRRNFEYYEARTLHGSSLSPAIHATIAARLGDSDCAMRYFRMAAEVDLLNNMGNASSGIHSAAQGGLWQATVFGFAGLSTNDNGISLAPTLPHNWKNLRFHVFWHGQPIAIEITPSRIEIQHRGQELETAIPVTIKLPDSPTIELEPGKILRQEVA